MTISRLLPRVTAIATVSVILVTGVLLGGCDIKVDPSKLPWPSQAEGTAEPGTDSPTVVAPIETAVPPPATAESPTREPRAAMPPPEIRGEPLADDAWWTLVRASGLPDMSPANDLGPATRLAVVANTDGLNSLRSVLKQPANAWVNSVPTGTLIAAVMLGARQGAEHDVEITKVAVADDAVEIAVAVAGPDEGPAPGDGPTVYPVHLVALKRDALPEGALTFRFVGGHGEDAPALPVDLRIDPERDDWVSTDGKRVGDEPPSDGPDPATGELATVIDPDGRFELQHSADWRTAPAPAEDDGVTWIVRLEQGRPGEPAAAGASMPPSGVQVDVGTASVPAGTALAEWVEREMPVDAEARSVTADDMRAVVGPDELETVWREGQILPFFGRWREWVVPDPLNDGRVYVIRVSAFGGDSLMGMIQGKAVVDSFRFQ